MKPAFREARQSEYESGQTSSECSVYHDAFVFHEIYGNGTTNPFDKALLEENMQSLPAAQAFQVKEVEDLFRGLLQRALLELHTFIPDSENIEGWFDKLFTLQQRFYADLECYAAAVANPEPAKVQYFYKEMNFYHRDEPIIATARALQRGEAVWGWPQPPRDVMRADVKPLRAHAATGLQLPARCQRILGRRHDAGSTQGKLDIGKMGRDGLHV